MPEGGLVAEFASASDLVRAVRELRGRGLTDLEPLSPIPVRELEDELGLPPSRLPVAVLAFGVLGAAGAYAVQWWTSAVAYPLIVGGMPMHSGLAYVPIVVEMTVLGAALAAFVGLLWTTGLPRLSHPVLEVPGIHRCTSDRFFLQVGRHDGAYDPHQVREVLHNSGAVAISPWGGDA